MFDRLKFKKKAGPAASSSAAAGSAGTAVTVLPGPKAEAEDAAFAPSAAHASAASPLLASTPPASSLNADLARSGSNGSENQYYNQHPHLHNSQQPRQLHQKISLSNLNGGYSDNNHNNNNYLHHHAMLNNATDVQGLPLSLEDGISNSNRVNTSSGVSNSNAIKVPVSNSPLLDKDRDIRARSHTYNNNSSNNFGNTVSGIASSMSVPSLTNSTQGPRINPATKPAVGTFAAATVTALPESAADLYSGSGHANGNSGTATTSGESSATPSRSSSTSNHDLKGGIGRFSTAGSTPLSATPPLTPRMSYDGAASADHLYYSTMGLTSAQQPQHPRQHSSTASSSIFPVSSLPSSMAASSIPATMASVAVSTIGQPDQRHSLDYDPYAYRKSAIHSSLAPAIAPEAQDRIGGGIDMGFVSSPVSYQAPSNPLSGHMFTQQPFPSTPQQHLPQQSQPSKHASTIRDTLLQQQQYQQQQLAQFREDFAGSESTNTAPNSGSGQSGSSAHEPVSQQREQRHSLIADSLNAFELKTAPAAAELVSTSAAPFTSPTFSIPASTEQLQKHDSTIPATHAVQFSLATPNSTVNTNTNINSGDSSNHPRASLDFVQPSVAAHGNGNGDKASMGDARFQGRGPGGTQAGGFSGVSGGGSSFFPAPITRASTAMAASHLITHDLRQTTEQSHIVDGAGPLVLMAIGKTGQGKSSLLNKIMGTNELKASASVRAVTKGIAERTGWGRFEDSRRVLVTLADTPGLADTEGDDEKNIPILKEYIRSVGKRIGVSAFLLVFKIDSGVDMILTILQTFNEIMKDFPTFWDNVVLVFTGCDYRRNVMNTKQFYHEEIQAQLQEHFFKDLASASGNNSGNGAAGDSGASGNRMSPHREQPGGTANGSATTTPTTPMFPHHGSSAGLLSEESSTTPVVPMVFLSCSDAPCGFALGEKCDCKARTAFLNAGIKRLWYAVKGRKRWVLDEDEDDDLLGHS